MRNADALYPGSGVSQQGLRYNTGMPNNPGEVRRFMSRAEYKQFKKTGFEYNPADPHGGISATSTKIKPINPDAIRKSTGARGADYYVDINVVGKNVQLKGMTKGGVPDWKIKESISPIDMTFFVAGRFENLDKTNK